MRAAVVGTPVAHSLSPQLHTAAYAALGLDWSYGRHEVSAAELPAFLDGLGPEWGGVSLTMPLKETSLPLLTTVSLLAAAVAAANTVVPRDGERHGHNTDVHGIVAALAEAGVTRARRAVVLGGGATARSALAALSRIGCLDPVLVVRSEPVETLAAAARLGMTPTAVPCSPDVLDGCDLLVSALPPLAADRCAPYVAGVPAVLDVVYDGWPTALAAAAGGTVVAGAAMLLHQAAGQVELMTGCAAPLEAMRAALPALTTAPQRSTAPLAGR